VGGGGGGGVIFRSPGGGTHQELIVGKGEKVAIRGR